MGYSRRDFLTLAGMGLLGCSAGKGQLISGKNGSPRPPNVVLILSDDLGYADIGIHGCEDIPTPHIDSVAHDGVHFTDGYVSSPLCSPTRAGLMTGRYQQRFGWEKNPPWPVPSPAMCLDEITMAEIMQSAGYRTGLIGKWHLGLDNGYHPTERGFDEYYGLEDFWQTGPGTAYLRNEKYITDVLTHKAREFIDNNADRPFFLFVSHLAVHTPWEATPEYLERFPHIEDPERKTYAAMVSALDDGVGQVREALRKNRIEEETLVFFLNDNNGWTNDPLRGHKGQMYEGGIRVPFLACWPGTIQAGQVCETPVISLDILPTAAAMAQARIPEDRPMDGVNLLPILTGKERDLPREYLFWRVGQDGACRHGAWKLVVQGNKEEMYNLEADPGEEEDLIGKVPDIHERLRAAYDEWQGHMMPPPIR